MQQSAADRNFRIKRSPTTYSNRVEEFQEVPEGHVPSEARDEKAMLELLVEI